jgi:hypothetical protein
MSGFGVYPRCLVFALLVCFWRQSRRSLVSVRESSKRSRESAFGRPVPPNSMLGQHAEESEEYLREAMQSSWAAAMAILAKIT